MNKDLSRWYTKNEAAELLRVSTKTVERAAARHELEQSSRPNSVRGKRPISVYSPDSLKRYQESITVSPTVEAPTTKAIARTMLDPVRLNRPGSRMSGAQDLVALVKMAAQEITVKDKLFLTIKESAKLSGLPQNYIKRMVQQGDLAALRIGRLTRIKKSNLQSFAV